MFYSHFSKQHAAEIHNARDSAHCQVLQGLHLQNQKKRVVSGTFLVLGQLGTFSWNKDSFSPCQREPERCLCVWGLPAQLGCHEPLALWQTRVGVTSYFWRDKPQRGAVPEPHARKPGLFSRPLRMMTAQLSEAFFGKNMSKPKYFSESLGFEAFLYPIKNVLNVRKFLAYSTTQKQF